MISRVYINFFAIIILLLYFCEHFAYNNQK